MDEAGSHANAQLILLGGGIFCSFQLRACPLRSLSLGVLIVCGGTLAALPFRRLQTIPDASAVPTSVTGPSQSALGSSAPDDSASSTEQIPSLADIDSLNELAAQTGPYEFAARQASQVRRQIDIPLTYDDLAVPLDQPKPIMDRFNATATVQKKQREEDRIAGLVMPPMESLPLAQQQELISVAKSIAPAEESSSSRASGRLASTASDRNESAMSVTSQNNFAPQQAVEPQRFWIRQPD